MLKFNNVWRFEQHADTVPVTVDHALDLITFPCLLSEVPNVQPSSRQ